ncbi:FadR/GntR family transcriptional regulator [Paracoccus sanguinis]|uniref:FadR/GntR family transcriptional regulator n=1 Tax=Paracoccus sanguinis TaxID=1545044 RepID=UPI0014514F05|nr:FadR/GntR family transcriptional regulator [Paracoccus sanguinis]QJD16512.1 FadR family transcriptional regulator [Paracoccus sanguinis]
MPTDTRSHRAWRQTADLILALVEAHRLAPGDRLPGERDLAERLGVSRPSLREALIALEVEGRIDIRMGSGVYLAAAPAAGTWRAGAIALRSDDDGPFEILEARAIIESAVADEAARRTTPELVAALDAILSRMEAATTDRPAAIRLDAAFHRAIAGATGNPVLVNLTSDVFDKRLTPLFDRLAGHFEGPGTWRVALAEHRAIRDAIAAGDPDAARAAMRRHLERSQQRFIQTFAEARPASQPVAGPTAREDADTTAT